MLVVRSFSVRVIDLLEAQVFVPCLGAQRVRSMSFDTAAARDVRAQRPPEVDDDDQRQRYLESCSELSHAITSLESAMVAFIGGSADDVKVHVQRGCHGSVHHR